MKINISMPAPRATSTVRIKSGDNLQLNFEPSVGEYSRSGEHLVVRFPNGGKIVIMDYFGEDIVELPNFILADGKTMLYSTDFLMARNPEMNLGPAEGAVSSSGGTGQYRGSDAELIGTIDRLGMTDDGGFQWSDGKSSNEMPNTDITQGQDFGSISVYGGKADGSPDAWETGLRGGSQEGSGSNSSPLYVLDWPTNLPDSMKPANGSEWRGEHGTVKFIYEDGVIKFQYTLDETIAHSGEGRDSAVGADSIKVTLTDSNGNSVELEFVMNIGDDAPFLARFDSSGNDTEAGGVMHGTWAAEFGADGMATDGEAYNLKVTDEHGNSQYYVLTPGQASDMITINGVDYGRLTLNSDGTFEFHSQPNLETSLNFVLGLKDADGDYFYDETGGGFTVTIDKPVVGDIDNITFTNGGNEFHEMYLESGSGYADGQDSALTVRYVKMPTYVDDNGVTQICKVDTSSNSWSSEGGGVYKMGHEFGFWTYDYNSDTLTFTFSKEGYHDRATEDLSLTREYDDFITFLSKNGNKHSEAEIKITVHDDAPDATLTTEAGQTGTEQTGTLNITGGADGLASLKLTVNGQEFDVTGATETSPATVTGQYGEMKVWFDAADGQWHYSYTPKGSSQITQDVTESFGFIITDGDGDTVTLNDMLQIEVEPVIIDPIEIDDSDGDGKVFEAGLGKGSKGDGSHETGWVELNHPDLEGLILTEQVYQGTHGTLEIRFNSATQKYEYKYTLSDNVDHDPGAGNNLAFDEIGVIMTHPDSDNTGTATIKVSVVDDTPTAEFVETSGGAGLTHTGSLGVIPGADGMTKLVIKVSDTDPGVDVTGATESSPATVNGLYGSMQVWQDAGGNWQYKYTAKDKTELTQEQTESFIFEVTDGDGDTVTLDDGLQITITQPIVIGSDDDGAGRIFEGGLADGTHEGQSSHPTTVNWTDLTQLQDGWSIETGTFHSANGKLEVREFPDGSGKFQYKYTLNDNVDHADDPSRPNNDYTDSFDLKITHTDTNTEHLAEFNFKVVDDAPVVEFGVADFSDQAFGHHKSGHSYEVNWGVDHGADGKADTGYNSLTVKITELDANGNFVADHEFSFADANMFPADKSEMPLGQFGSISWEGGKWVFKAAPNQQSDVEFTLTGRDGDGDAISSSQTVEVRKPGFIDENFKIGGNDAEILDEKYLTAKTPQEHAGTEANSTQLVMDLDTMSYSVDYTTGGWTPAQGGGYILQGSNGYLWTNGTDLKYYLTNKVAHNQSHTDRDAVDLGFETGITSITLKASDGNTYEVPVEIRIQDDIPLITGQVPATTDTDSGGAPVYISGKEYNGTVNIKHGADGPAAQDATQVEITLSGGQTSGKVNLVPGENVITIDGKTCVIKLNADGTFSFKSAPNATETYTLTFTATDSEGDSYTYTMDPISVTKPDGTGLSHIGTKDGGPAYEALLPGGSGEVPGGVDPSGGTSVELNVPNGYTVVTDSTWTQDSGDPNLWYKTGDSGNKLVWDSVNGKLTYEMTNPLDHKGGSNTGNTGDYKDTLADDFDQAVTLKDAHGNTETLDVSIGVVDDVADVDFAGTGANSGADTVVSGREFTGGEWELDYGADGAGKLEVVVTIDGQTKTFTVGPDGKVVVEFDDGNGGVKKYGTLTLNEYDQGKGSFSFDSEPNLVGEKINLQLKATDGDGDVTYSSQFELTLVKSGDFVITELGTAGGESFSESYLQDGTGYQPGQADSHVTKVIVIPNDTEGNPYTVNTDSSLGWTGNATDGYVLQGTYGHLTYKNGVLTYTLTDNAKHGAGGDPHNLMPDAENLQITLVDYAGNDQTPVDLVVNIKDDAPVVSFTAKDGSASGVEHETGGIYEGGWNVNFGADGAKDWDGDGQGDANRLFLRVSDGSTTADFEITVNGPAVDVIINNVNYGSLKLIDDGNGGKSYIFTSNPNKAGDLNFKLGAEDSDGDVSWANDDQGFTITTKVPDQDLDLNVEGGASIDESWLPGGTDHDPSRDLTKEIELPKYTDDDGNEQTCTVDTDGWTDKGGGVYTKETDSGTLTYDSNGNELTYTQDKTIDHSGDGRDSVKDSTEITIIGKNDNEYTVTIEMDVTDDAPTVTLDLDGNTTNFASGTDFTGTWSLEHGADGKADVEYNDLSVTYTRYDDNGNAIGTDTVRITDDSLLLDGSGMPIGDFGTLYLDGDTGEFRFEAKPNVNVDLEFKLSGKDGDNDVTSDSFDVTVRKPGFVEDGFFVGSKGEYLDEQYLTVKGDQQHAGSTGGSEAQLTVDLDILSYEVDVTQGNWTFDSNTGTYVNNDGKYGYLTYTPPSAPGANDQTLTYTLNKATTSSEQGRDEGNYDDGFGSIVLVDANGNSWDIPTKIAITDDIPVAMADCSWDDAGAKSVLSGKEASGTWSVKHGADGPAAQDASTVKVSFELNGTTVDLGTHSAQPGSSYDLYHNGDYYGTLTLSGGQFVFKPAPDTEGKFNLTFTGKDSEGDLGSHSLDINVTKPSWPGSTVITGKDGAKAYEALLDDGTGNAPGGSSARQALNLPEGCKVDTTGWDQVGGGYEKSFGNGKLVWDGSTLWYQLTGNFDHADGQGNNSLFHEFGGVKGIDQYGNSFDISIKMEVVDDIPVIDHSQNPGDVYASGVFTGNLSEPEFGADGQADAADHPLQVIFHLDGVAYAFDITPGGAPVEIILGDGASAKKYGEFTLNPDYSYEFATEHGTGGTDLYIQFQATDKDGDISTSDPTLVEILELGSLNVTLGRGANEDFNEAFIPGLGSAHDDAGAYVTRDIGLPAGYKIDVNPDASGGGKAWQPQGGTLYKLEGANGYLLYDTVSGKLTYTLTSPIANPTGGIHDNYGFDTIGGIVLIDPDGYVRSDNPIKAEIKIHDDAPDVEIGAGQSGETSVTSGHEYEGAWEIDYGADGKNDSAPGKLMIEVGFDGKTSQKYPLEIGVEQDIHIDGDYYGKLTLNNDGTYTFVAAPDLEGDLNFKLYGSDSEGDESSGSFTLTVDKAQGPSAEFLETGNALDESQLPGGNADNGNGLTSSVIDIPAGYTLDISQGNWSSADGGSTYTWDSPNGYGYLLYNAGTGELSYVLDSRVEHTAQGADSKFDLIEGITLKDGKGNSFNIDAKVEITDDTPDLAFGDKGLSGADSMQLESGTGYTGSWSANPGADGAASEFLSLKVSMTGADPLEISNIKIGESVTITIGGKEYGTFTLTSATEYNFTAAGNVNGKLNFQLTATDSEGDSTSQTFTFDVQEAGGPADYWIGKGAVFSEAYLSNGSQKDSGEPTTRTLEVPEGFHIDVTQGNWQPHGNGYMITMKYGNLICSADGKTLQYQHLRTAANKDGIDGEVAFDTAQGLVIIKDGTSNSFTYNASIEIRDDAPVVDFAASGSNEGEVISGTEFTGEYTLSYGADRAAKTDAIQLKVVDADGNSATFTTGAGNAIIVKVGGVEYGTLYLDEGSTFKFKANPNVDGKLELHLTVTDGDGDTVSSGDPFELTFTKPGGPGIDHLGGGADEWFDDRNIVGDPSDPGSFDGTAKDASQATKAIKIPDGYTIDTGSDGWVEQGSFTEWNGVTLPSSAKVYTKGGENGTLTYFVYEDGSGQRLTFTLEKAAGHKNQGIEWNEDFASVSVGNVTLVDNLGNSYKLGTDFTVYDDQPQLVIDGNPNAQSGREYTGGWSLAYGADGPAGQNSLEINITVKINGGATHTISGSITPGSPYAIYGDGGVYLGSITLNQGIYKFTPAPNLEAKFSFTLTATDGDGDRVSTGEHVINVSRVTDPNLPSHLGGNEDERFFEANLEQSAKNPHEGTNPDGGALTKDIALPGGYTIAVSAQDGWTQTSPGVWTKDGAYGKLTYTESSNKLTYTLESAPDVAGTGKNVTEDVIGGIKLKDKDGNTFELDAKISIEDDTPTSSLAGEDASGQQTDSIVLQAGATYDDGVWNAKFGADGPAGSGSLTIKVSMSGAADFEQAINMGDRTEIILNGQTYGWLTLNSDGTYSFEAGNNLSGQLSFVLTSRDGDGDAASSGGFNITIPAPNGPGITHLGHDKTFDEGNFDNGTRKDLGNLIQELEVPEGFRIDVSSGGWVKQADGSYKWSGKYGTLIASADGSELKYELTGRLTNDQRDQFHGDDYGYDIINNVRLLDDNNNEFFLNAQVKIMDDAPELTFGDGTTHTMESGGTYESNVGDYVLKFGADGAAAQKDSPLMLHFKVNGQSGTAVAIPPGGSADVIVNYVKYGTLTLDANGKFVFTAEPNLGADDPVRIELSLAAKDRDGDSVDSHDKPVVIEITKPAGPPAGYFLGGNGEKVSESNLDGGSNPDSNELTQTLTLPDGFVPDTEGWASAGSGIYTKTSAGNHGTLTWNSNTGKLTYTLDGTMTHQTQGKDSAQDVFSGIKLKDKNGNTYEVETKITVEDDMPTDLAFGGSAGEMNAGEVYTGYWNAEFGADGQADSGSHKVVVTVNGVTATFELEVGVAKEIKIDGVSYGTLTLTDAPYAADPSKGSTFTFVSDGSVKAQLEFNFVATDKDGDTASSADNGSSFVINIEDPITKLEQADENFAFDESKLAEGTAPATNPSDLISDIAMPVNAAGDPYTIVTQGTDWQLVGTDANGVQTWHLEAASGILIYKVDPSGAQDPTLQYKLTSAAEHDKLAGNDTKVVLEVGEIILKTPLGNEFAVKVEVKIQDDAPVMDFARDQNGDPIGGDVDLAGNNYVFETSGEFAPDFGADGAMTIADGGNEYLVVTVDFGSTGSVSGSGRQNIALGLNGDPVEVMTKLGKVTLSWDSATESIKYEYTGLRGRQNDQENVKVTIYDKDGDASSSDFTITLQDTIPDLRLVLDEAGLAFGSNSVGSGDSYDSGTLSDTQLPFEPDAIVWEYQNIGNIQADGNLDGSYTNVIWNTDSNGNLIGTADGQVVIRITPSYDADGKFTGQMTAEILKPFKHDGGRYGDTLDISIDFKQVDGQGNEVKSNLVVTVKDDAPFGNTEGGATKDHQITLHEPADRYEEVFIAMDFSGSMGSPYIDGMPHPTENRNLRPWEAQIKAIVELAETYLDNGISANFNLVAFASTAWINPALKGISAQELIDMFKPLIESGQYDAARNILCGLPNEVGGGTSFIEPTNVLMSLLDQLEVPDYVKKTVYFMTDGLASAPTAWYEYIRTHHGEFNIFSIGMGNSISNSYKNILTDIAGSDSSHFIEVNDFGDLSDALKELVDPVTGNILNGISSADHNKVLAIYIGDKDGNNVQMHELTETDYVTGLKHTKPIYFGENNEVKVVFYEDGSYELYTANVESDMEYTIRVVVEDADGDRVMSDVMDLVIKDSKPVAYDNLAKLELTSEYEYMGNMLRDPSPNGDVDDLSDKAKLFKITYGGKDYFFDNGDVVIDTGKGVLTVKSDGQYTYKSHDGNYREVDEEFTYTLKDRDGDTSTATVEIKWNNTLAYDNLGSECDPATYTLGDFSVSASGGASASSQPLADQGWFWHGETLRAGGSISSGHNPLPENPYIGSMPQGSNIHISNPYYVSQSQGNDRSKAVMEDLFGTTSLEEVREILNDIGVNGTTHQMNAGLASSTFDMGLVSRTFTADGGKLAFSWSFQGDRMDASWWFLKDANGNIIDGGVLYQCTGGESSTTRNGSNGVQVIDLPPGMGGEYTLVVGMQNIGNGLGDPDLYIGDVALVLEHTYSGNVITDPSMDGEMDFVHSTTRLDTIEYDGTTYQFSDSVQVIKIDTGDGILSINSNGAYIFTPKQGGGDIPHKFEYTLTDGEAGNSGTLYLQKVGAQAYDNVAVAQAEYSTSNLINDFNGTVTSSGWRTETSATLSVRSLDSALLKPQPNEYLDKFSNGMYLAIGGRNELSLALQNSLFGLNKSGETFDEFMGELDIKGNILTSSEGLPYGSFASKTFTSTGGKLVFDWALGGTQSVNEQDLAIWILQDSQGNVLAYGLLNQLDPYAAVIRKYGVESIDLPLSGLPQTYTLITGTIQAGTSLDHNPSLYIGTVVAMEDPHQFSGNMLKDPGPDGQIDHLQAGAKLVGIEYEGKEYAFDASGKLVIETLSGGKLIVYDDGSYFYSDARGGDGSRVAEDFKYTVQNADGGTDDAMLFVRGDHYLHQGTGNDDVMDHSSSKTPDLIIGGGGHDTLTGGSGDNVIYGSNGNDKIYGSSGNDYIFGGGGNDILVGGAGNDIMYGGAGNDKLYGGEGNDIIFGGAGFNQLSGGAGADIFAWKNSTDIRGLDQIMDFSTDEGDKLSFEGLFKPGESLSSYLTGHVSGLNLNASENTLSFTIHDGKFEKAVEVHFNSGDSMFSNAIAEYNSNAGNTEAQDQALMSFLQSISGGI